MEGDFLKFILAFVAIYLLLLFIGFFFYQPLFDFLFVYTVGIFLGIFDVIKAQLF